MKFFGGASASVVAALAGISQAQILVNELSFGITGR